MQSNIQAAVIGAFVADALALGVHWVYDPDAIKAKYGNVENMVKPELAAFHSGKEKGAFTHYGDQMMVLLDSVAAKSGFDAVDFADRWKTLFADYSGYMDHATKETLANFEQGIPLETAGSSSSDLAGASRIAPLLAQYAGQADKLIEAARAQTMMTHNHPRVLAGAELFARTAALTLQGASPLAAVKEASQAPSIAEQVGKAVQAGIDSRGADTRQAISKFGLMCDVEAALPGTIHLIAKYENSFKEALVANIMAGGDSAARGIPVGMILGSAHGMSAIPEQWLGDMAAYPKISEMIAAVTA